MGNNNTNGNSNNEICTNMNEEQISNLRKTYKIIDVDYLATDVVNYKMFGDNYFILPNKKEAVHKMLAHYLNNDFEHKVIYKKTDYLCNKKEKVCICNTHADAFRKIYDGVNYSPNVTYIRWVDFDINP
jgi:hypothetical protein